MIEYNFSSNLTTLGVNVTDIGQYGIQPVACIPSTEVLASMNRVEIIYGFIAFLLLLDVAFTALSWWQSRKKVGE